MKNADKNRDPMRAVKRAKPDAVCALRKLEAYAKACNDHVAADALLTMLERLQETCEGLGL